jgi:hypothetical protein
MVKYILEKSSWLFLEIFRLIGPIRDSYPRFTP